MKLFIDLNKVEGRKNLEKIFKTKIKFNKMKRNLKLETKLEELKIIIHFLTHYSLFKHSLKFSKEILKKLKQFFFEKNQRFLKI